MHTPREVDCWTCLGTGNVHVRMPQEEQAGIPVYVATDRPCPDCSDRARRWLSEAMDRRMYSDGDRRRGLTRTEG